MAALTNDQRLDLLEQCLGHLQNTTEGFDQFKKTGRGSEWRAALKVIDKLKADLRQAQEVRAAVVGPTHTHLGPVLAGHKSVCDNDLTHATSGFAFHPAFDDLEKAGAAVLAPEDLTITKWGSAKGGESLHATGTSGIHWWFGHVDKRRPVGTKVKRGQRIATVSAEHEHPHVHVGLDARALVGVELEHHTNYTHGGPSICSQLSRRGGHV
jgi:hypothetical protein